MKNTKQFLLAVSLLATALTLQANPETPKAKCECRDGKPCACGDACTCDNTPAKAENAPAANQHPLKGVVVDVVAAKGMLVVKHEEIPGVMKAMTMGFKVDETALKTVKKGDALTGLMSRQADGWHLDRIEVKAP